MTSPTPSRQELPIVLRALDRLTQEGQDDTQAQCQERLVALTRAACHEEGLDISEERVAATVAQVLTEAGSEPEQVPVSSTPSRGRPALTFKPEKPSGLTRAGWQRPPSLQRWTALVRRHQRPVIRWVRSLFGEGDFGLVNLSTLLGISLLGGALGHWVGLTVGPHTSEVLMVVGCLGTSLAVAQWAERLAGEHHSIQEDRVRPGLLREVTQWPEATEYLRVCEASEVPLLRGDVDVLRQLVTRAR